MSIRSAFVGTCISKLQEITRGSFSAIFGRNSEDDEDEDEDSCWREPITFESVNFLTNSAGGDNDNDGDDSEEEVVVVMAARFV